MSGGAFAVNVFLPAVIFALTFWLAGCHPPIAVSIALSLLIVAAIGLIHFQSRFNRLRISSAAVPSIASVGGHLALQGFGLLFLGAEGQRGPTLAAPFSVAPWRFTGQSIAVYAITHRVHCRVWLFFGFTLYGQGAACHRRYWLGARLVGIPTGWSGCRPGARRGG